MKAGFAWLNTSDDQKTKRKIIWEVFGGVTLQVENGIIGSTQMIVN